VICQTRTSNSKQGRKQRDATNINRTLEAAGSIPVCSTKEGTGVNSIGLTPFFAAGENTFEKRPPLKQGFS
jgi:hypothetical protein